MTEWHLLLYGSLKVAAYSAVCHVGLVWVGRRRRLVLPVALGLGLLRAAMGLVFGVGIFFASAAVLAATPGSTAGPLLAYLAVYVPVRWIEWSLIALLVAPDARSGPGFLFGADGRDRLWRVLGIVVSCAADVPVFAATGGMPVGRFMC